jgi:hypothetical protein
MALTQPSLGTMRILCDRMRLDADNVEIQIKVARALTCLCFNNSSGVEQAVACGAINNAVAALRRHHTNEFSVVKMLELLQTLAAAPRAQATMRQGMLAEALHHIGREVWLGRSRHRNEVLRMKGDLLSIATAQEPTNGAQSGTGAATGTDTATSGRLERAYLQ